MKKLIILFVILSLTFASCLPKAKLNIGVEVGKNEEDQSKDIASDFLMLIYSADKDDVEELNKLISSEPVKKDGVSRYSYEDKYIAYLKDKYKDIPIEENEWEDLLANRYINFMAKMALDNDTTYNTEVISLKYVESLKEFEYEVDCAGKNYKGSVRLEDGVIVNAEIDIKGK